MPAPEKPMPEALAYLKPVPAGPSAQTALPQTSEFNLPVKFAGLTKAALSGKHFGMLTGAGALAGAGTGALEGYRRDGVAGALKGGLYGGLAGGGAALAGGGMVHGLNELGKHVGAKMLPEGQPMESLMRKHVKPVKDWAEAKGYGHLVPEDPMLAMDLLAVGPKSIASGMAGGVYGGSFAGGKDPVITKEAAYYLSMV